MRKLVERSLPLRLFAQWNFILRRHSGILRSCSYHLEGGLWIRSGKHPPRNDEVASFFNQLILRRWNKCLHMQVRCLKKRPAVDLTMLDMQRSAVECQHESQQADAAESRAIPNRIGVMSLNSISCNTLGGVLRGAKPA